MERGLSRVFMGSFAFVASFLLASFTEAAEMLPLFRATALDSGDPAPLEIEIHADFSQILGRRYGYGTDKKARLRVPAEIRLVGDEAKRYPVVQMAEISGRGALRGNECSFPPLKIEFQGRPAAPSYFQGVDEIKVVTHCGKNVLGRSATLQEQLLKEFTVYRLHALAAAPANFQARLAWVRYIDTSGQMDEVNEYAIFVEDISDLTKRLGAKRLFSQKDVGLKSYDPTRLTTRVDQFSAKEWVEMLMFQTMIWNYDFEVGHNLKGIVGEGGWKPVPYDFDYSELFYRRVGEIPTNTWMAFPYRCLSKAQVDEMGSFYKQAGQEMTKLIRATKYISYESKQIAIANIESATKYFEQMPRPHNDEEVSPCSER